MKVVTAKEMRNIDFQTINEIGIPGIVLMENAGSAVVKAIERDFPLSKFHRVAIFAGKGNNGGDGLVIARHLAQKGYEVTIYLLAEPEKFSGDALINLKIAQNIGLKIDYILSDEQLNERKADIKQNDIIIDAIFGTGLSGPVRGFAGSVIDYLNSTEIPIIAVDLPSGLDSDTGKVEGVCIKAKMTVTMALPKRGLLLYPGANFVGKLEIDDIGIPQSVINSNNIPINLTQIDHIKTLLPKRPRDGHKGLFGRVLVISGSVGLTGASAMASLSALRVGAGLVTLGVPESLNPIMEVKLTEVMTLPLPETSYQTLSLQSYDIIMQMVDKFDVIAIGPGLSRNRETMDLVQRLCKDIKIPKVIDADGLNALAEDKDSLKKLGEKTVLTPHPGEMARLTDKTISDVQADRIDIAVNFAKEYGVVLVLKGVPTVVADPSGEAYLNTTGNPGMASGGTGDVLTGAITGFLAQGLDEKNSAILGVYVHGLAGDLASIDKGECGLIAGDLIDFLPKAIKKIAGN
ncbi:MAG: NAD(P)H-hydrate dehydratase [Candidatus Poribacteria bacterium]